MTIKEIAELTGLNYSVVYNALSAAGLLVRGSKNHRYYWRSAVCACMEYLNKKVDAHLNLAREYVEDISVMRQTLEKNVQKQG